MRTSAALLILTAVVVVALSAATTAQQRREPMPVGNVEHGKYIVEHVAMCIECHSPRDENGEIVAGKEFLGGSLPFKGPTGWATFAPRNRGLLGYDDDLAMRLLTEGAIARDGGQLRAPMPRFHMTRQDAADVIAFMRSMR